MRAMRAAKSRFSIAPILVQIVRKTTEKWSEVEQQNLAAKRLSFARIGRQRPVRHHPVLFSNSIYWAFLTPTIPSSLQYFNLHFNKTLSRSSTIRFIKTQISVLKGRIWAHETKSCEGRKRFGRRRIRCSTFGSNCLGFRSKTYGSDPKSGFYKNGFSL